MGHRPHKVAPQFASSGTTTNTVNMDQWCAAANDASVQCFLKTTLQSMISDDTRELHIEEETDFSRVRMRVNGRLTEQKIDNPSLATELLGSIGNEGQSKLDKSANDDFGELKVPVQIDGKKLDLTISHYRTVVGKSLTLEVHNAESIPEVLEQTRLDPGVRQRLRQHYQAIESKGVTLICSHSVNLLRSIFYALLGEVNSVERKTVSFQRNTERRVPRVSQILTGDYLTATNSEKSISELRELMISTATLSDHIFVDWETTKIKGFTEAMRAVAQNQISITLLWHGDVSTGLLNLIAPVNSLSLKLGSIIETQDTGLICPHCAEVYVPNKLDYARLPESFAKDQPESYFYANGCSRCDDTGISSMTTITSISTSSDSLRDALASGSLTATEQAIAKAQEKEFVKGQIEKLARSGKISFEDWVKQL